MKNATLKACAAAAAMLLLPQGPSWAQGNLQFGPNSGPAGSGPTTTPGPATLYRYTSPGTYASFVPATTVTISFSNQQFTNQSSAGLVAGARQGSSGTTVMTALLMDSLTQGDCLSSDFTADPFGTTGTGITASAFPASNDSWAFRMFTDATYLKTAGASNGNATRNGKYYYGNITITFSRPVRNPVLHLAGIGGSTFTSSSTTSSGGVTTYNNMLGYYTELGLSSTDRTAGVKLKLLSQGGSGKMQVGSIAGTADDTTIINTSTNPGSVQQNLLYYADQTTGMSGSGGSVQVVTPNEITSVTFQVYLRGDGGNTQNSATAADWSDGATRNGDAWQLGVSLPLFSLSGHVYNDVNALKDNTVNGVSTNLPTVYANLVDGSGNVYASQQVSGTGTYTFSNVIPADAYTVKLSAIQGVVSTTTGSVPSLPSAGASFGGIPFINTGEFVNPTGSATGNDGAADGQLFNIAVGTTSTNTNVSNVDFAIEQRPTAGYGETDGITTPLGVLYYTLQSGTTSPFVFNTAIGTHNSFDQAPGALAGGGILITGFPTNTTSFKIGSTTYYPASLPVIPPGGTAFPAAGVVVATNSNGVPTATIQVDPSFTGSDSIMIPYVSRDAAELTSINAGREGTAILRFVTPLPVVLKDFNASLVNCQAVATWDAGVEQALDHYELQVSRDAKEFATVATRNAAGSESHYSVAVDQQNGIAYYRLKMVDVTGYIAFSPVVSVNKTCGSSDIQVYPNPTTGVLNINNLETGAEASVYDMQGHKLASVKSEMDRAQLDLGKFATGVYQVVVTDLAGGHHSFRVVRQ